MILPSKAARTSSAVWTRPASSLTTICSPNGTQPCMSEGRRYHPGMLVLQFFARYSLAILLPALALLIVAEGQLRLSYLQYALLGSFAIYMGDVSTRRQRL